MSTNFCEMWSNRLMSGLIFSKWNSSPVFATMRRVQAPEDILAYWYDCMLCTGTLISKSYNIFLSSLSCLNFVRVLLRQLSVRVSCFLA